MNVFKNRLQKKKTYCNNKKKNTLMIDDFFLCVHSVRITRSIINF